MAIGKMTMLGEMQRFKDSMAANVDDLSGYEGGRIRFESLVKEAQALTQQQAALTAAKQEVSKKLQVVLAEAQQVATVLRFAVKAQYGRDAEKLVEFGLQPFRGRSRKQQPETPPAPSASSAE